MRGTRTHKDGSARDAVVYCRVSTEGQAVDGVSLAAQKERAVAWCRANGYRVRHVFVDAGLSGAKAANRPGLQKALEAVKGRPAALVVYSLSRLARSVKDTLRIAEELEKAGADLVSLSERIDTTTAAGTMVFRMLAVLAEFERDLVSERTCAALGHKRARGERVGTVPLGYDLAEDGVALVDNPAEARVLEVIARMREAGKSYRAIAAELTRRGIPTKTGRERWAHTAVARIVKRLDAEAQEKEEKACRNSRTGRAG